MEKLSLSLATDESILKLSHGEVKNFGKYLNYGYTPKPEVDGLFCQKIFGPIVDYTCDCGITKKVSNNEICGVCHVPYIPKFERNNRFGHIELNTYILPPIAVELVAEIWGVPKKAFEDFIFTSKTKLIFKANSKGVFYSTEGQRYQLAIADDEDENTIDSLYTLVKHAEKLNIDYHVSMMENKHKSAKIYFEKGFHIFSMLLTKFPVEPCGMRDRKKMGDELVYHEDNLIYHRIIRDALRIKNFKAEIEDPTELDELISYETRVIQRLINGFLHKGYKANNKSEIPAKVNVLNEKKGLLRGSALGKRFDFSGRTFITSGPHLKPDTVGVPILILKELFLPDLIGRISKLLVKKEGVTKIIAIKKARKIIHSSNKEDVNLVTDLIYSISKNYYALLNRAPSLHRFSVMSYKIEPHSDKCVYFPPLACKPFNADFDGDTMSISIMHSKEAMKELEVLVSFRENLLSTVAPNTPNASLSHEMVVGAYLLTKGYDTADWKDKPITKYYNSISDVERDLYFGYIKIDDKVVLIVNNAKYTLTAGSVLLYKNTGIVVDYVLNKGGVNKLISGILTKYNTDKQIDVLHKLQTLVFEAATKYGLTISIEDTKTNPEYAEILSKAKQEADSLPLTDTVEVNGKVIPRRALVWDNAFNICVDRWFKETPIENNLQLMGKGGARVTEVQVKAMILGKGLQTNMDNSINPNAIIQSLSSGLDPWNYFNTCGSARRSFTSNVAVTPASGYMTRQFITNARDLQITTEDCGTNKTIVLPKNLALYHYDSEGKLITKDTIHTYNDFVSVRSPLTCEHTNGLCSKCCGVNLKNSLPWKIGFGIGSSAAHTCSEGVTQATLRGKHCQIGSDTFFDINFNEIRFKDAKKAIDRGHNIYVHSMNSEGKFEVKKVLKVYNDRMDNKYVKITFDNGKTINCTLDHPLILRNGELIEAKNLKPGQSMMPYYFNKSDGKKSYNKVRNNDKDKTWSVGYILSSDHYDFKSIYDGNGVLCRHHIDFSKTNDYPTNLLGCTAKQHIKLHNERLNYKRWTLKDKGNTFRFGENPEIMQKIAEHNREPWRRKLTGETISKWSRENPEIKRQHGLKSGASVKRIAAENPEYWNEVLEKGSRKLAQISLKHYIDNGMFDVTTSKSEDYDKHRIQSLRFIFDNYPDLVPLEYNWYSSIPVEHYLGKQERQNLSFYDKYLNIMVERGLSLTYENLVEIENEYPRNYKPSRNIDWISKYRDISVLEGVWASELPYDFYWTRSEKQAFSRYKNVFLELHKLGWVCDKEKYERMFSQLYPVKTSYSKYETCLENLPDNYIEYIFPQGNKEDPLNNHKVSSVEIIELPREIPFYGLEVEGEWHNYPTGAGVMSHNTSGSVNLKTYGKQVDDILADILSFLGGRSTQLVKLSSSTVEHSIDDLEGNTYEERASNFTQIMDTLFKNAGLNYGTIWYEVIGRALSDIVLEGKVPVGYRSKGYKTDEPKFMNLFKANTVSPSWLKSISFGYTKKGLRDGIRHRKSTLNLATEKIIMGKNILDD